MVSNKIIVGVLVLLIASVSIVYISMNDVKIRVDTDKSTFYVIENNRWVVSGREYLNIFEGTTKLNRNISGIKIETFIDDVEKTVTIIKTTPYIKGPIIKQTYFFDGTLNSKERFPVYHKIEVTNASGMFLRYEVKDLIYSGNTYKLSGETLLSFGRSMKLNLSSNYRWAWVYKTGAVSAQYDINSDYEVYNFRLYDPATVTTLYLNGSSVDRIVEIGEPLNITGIIDTAGLQVCLSVNHTYLGENFTCGTTSVQYIWSPISSTNKFNDSTTEKNLTYSSLSNNTVYYRRHSYDLINSFRWNLTGVNTSGDNYPSNVRIFINDSLSNSISGRLKEGVSYLNTFNDSSTAKNLTFTSAGSQVAYLSLAKNAIVIDAKLNLSGYTTLDSNIIINGDFESNNLNNWTNWTWNNSQQLSTYAHCGIFDGTYATKWDSTWISDVKRWVGMYQTLNTAIGSNNSNISWKWNQVTPNCGDLYFIKIYFSSGQTIAYYRNNTGCGVYPDADQITDMNANVRIRLGSVSSGVSSENRDIYKDYYDNIGNPSGLNITNITWQIFMRDSYAGYIGAIDSISIKMNYYPKSPYLDVEGDGDTEWNHTGEFNSTYSPNRTANFSDSLNHYLGFCTADSYGNCKIPLVVGSNSAGIIQLSAVNITYNIYFNPITLNTTYLQNFLDNSSYGYVDIPIRIEANQGNVTAKAINSSYNGTGALNVTAFYAGNATYSASSDTQYVTNYYSRFTNKLPYTFTSQVIFLPKTNSSQNVTPFAQTSTTPIFNVTWKNYGVNASLAIRINQTINSCLNFTASNTSSKNNGFLLNTSYQRIFNNSMMNSTNTTNIWLWADLTNCNATALGAYVKAFELKSCCIGCMSCGW